jgi:type IV pilus secretin PilQ/predicted competence protein
MTRHRLRFVLVLLGLGLALSAANRPGRPAVSDISIVPAKAHLRLVLDAGIPAGAVEAAYAKDIPSLLVVALGRVTGLTAPTVPAEETALVTGLKLETAGDGITALLLSLKEPVPFRIYAEGPKTIVELTKILKTGADLLPAEIQTALNAPGRTGTILRDLDIRNDAQGLSAVARLSQKPVTNVFALANPLRLVIDVYDTVFARPSLTRPVQKYGVDVIRAAQYKTPPPYSVTRLVFEMSEARRYDIVQGTADMTISFPAMKPAAGVAAPTAKPTDTPPPPADTVKTANPPPSPAPAKAEVKAADQDKAADAAGATQEDKAKAQTIRDGAEKYAGELISPRFKDADLRDVILWLGEKVGLNVTFDPEVRGSVTCSFDLVPWDQFLDIILKTNKLGKTLEGNVLRIAPLSVLADEERSIQQLRDAQEQAGALLTRTITLSYAKSRDLLELLKNKKSPRGEVVIDERTNTIIITDVKDKLDLVEKLVAALDTQTQQVQIEVRIIEATSTFVRNLGVQWGWKGTADAFYGNQTSLQFPNKILADGAMIPQGIVTKGVGGPLGGYAINLPASSFTTAVGLSFANILDTFRLDMAITAMETEGNGRIVSTERATTMNNKEAYINQGRQIPVQTQANFTVTTQYINAGLELRATPQITADGTIVMTLDIQNNAADFANLVNGIPPITTQSAKMTVMVPDGGTTVLGGIYRVEDSITKERVPLLYQIPILGKLFQSFSRTKQNRELLIFITPRIIQ